MSEESIRRYGFIALALALVVPAFAFAQSPADELAVVPSLKVSVGPYGGVIPAKFANGRPVYLFQAQATMITQEEQKPVVVRDEVLLQAGMSAKFHEKYEKLELRGAISIDRNGTARYGLTVAENGRIVNSSEAHLVSGDRQASHD